MPRRKKNILHPVIMVDRKAFLSALRTVSAIIQSMGDEFELIRSDDGLDSYTRKTLLQLIGVHLKNVASLGISLQESMHDPLDPDGTKGKELN